MKPFIFGHRGCAYEPENTLRSIKKAIEFGIDGVEVDVRRCKSKEIVVIHDEKVDRTTNGKGYVKDFYLMDLQKLDAGKREKIPTLEELIKFIKNIDENSKKQIKLIIELKEKGLEKDIIDLIGKYSIDNHVIVISFHQEFIKEIKNLSNKIKTGFLYSKNLANVLNLAKEVNLDFLFPDFNYANENLIKNAHKNKLKVFVWNIDDFENLKKILKLNVDGIGSNKPDIIVDYFKNRK